MKTIKFNLSRFNLIFLIASILVMEFCLMIFPGIRYIYAGLGASLPAPAEFFYEQCWAIQTHPLIAFVGFGGYYAVSIYTANAKINAAVNMALLLYLAVMMAGLGLPLIKIGQEVSG